MSLGLVRPDSNVPERRNTDCINKWEIFGAITECSSRLGVNDRTLSVLHALISFHRGPTMDAGDCLVVFPSNRRLSLRAHRMPESTLRRHLAALIKAGLVERRDSPNGKRYTRRQSESFERIAYGFDLTPIVARARSFLTMAGEIRAQERERGNLRCQISVLQRDVRMLLLGSDQGDHTLVNLRERLSALSKRPGERTPLDKLHAQYKHLSELKSEVEVVLAGPNVHHELGADGIQNERHIQDSKISESITDLEDDLAVCAPTESKPTSPRPINFTLSSVLDACPDIEEHSQGGIANWQALVRTADLVRCYLAIPTDAWEEARSVFNPVVASTVLAAILQRSDSIRTPGAYLRTLTKKALQRQFSPAPMLMALTRAHLRAKQTARPSPQVDRRPTRARSLPPQITAALVPRLDANRWQPPKSQPPS